MIKNCLRNRRRSILTIGSIAVSLCLLGVLFAIYHALFLSEPTPAQALRLISRHRVSLTQSMPISYRSKIEAVPGVKQVMVWIWFGGTYKDTRDPNNFFARFAAEPDRVFTIHTEYTIPEDQKQAFIHERTACVVSRKLAEKLHFQIGDRITLVGDYLPVTMELKLVGIFDSPENDEVMYFSREYLHDALLAVHSPLTDQAGAFQIQANSAEDVPRIAKAVDALFENAPQPTKTESERQFQLSFASFVGNLKLFLLMICGAVTFTILLVSANTVSMSVRERVREVGILKTLGFKPGQVLSVILGESTLIAGIGGILGCALAQLLCILVRNSPAGSFIGELRALTLTPGVTLVCIGVALMIGLVSSFVPAWNASRTPILESLRYSG